MENFILKKRLAIITPGFKPVPSVDGGAIEQLITNMVVANEITHTYDIDLYTIYDRRINQNDFNYTNIIYAKSRWYDVVVRGINFIKRRFFKIGKNNFQYISYMMSREFKTGRYDTVLVENNMDTYESILKKIQNERTFFHLHNDFACGDPAKSEIKTRKVISSANGILVVSNYLKKKLENYGAKNVLVVPNFVNSRQFDGIKHSQEKRLKEKYHLKKDDIVVTYVGRLDKEKGVDKLLQALLLLKDNEKIKCLVVGDFLSLPSEYSHETKLRKLAKALNGKIIFTGYIKNEDLGSIYDISNFVVIPSQCEEAFGLVALEAMKMKKAVIASDAGGLPEVLSTKGAIIIERNDKFISNLSLAIRKLSDDKALCKKMGEFNYIKSKSFPQNNKEYFSLIVNALNM